MKIPKIYRNFYLRNLIVLFFFTVTIFSCVYNDLYNEQNVYQDPPELLTKIVVAIIPIYILITVSNLVLIKGLFLNKRYNLFVTVFIGYWVCCHFLLNWYFEIVILKKLTILNVVIAMSNGTGFYFLHLWIVRNIAEGRKEMINVASELSFLKQQLNPHFLLNAMNNLYGESLSTPDKVPERILNLSDMLRYQIEATKKNLVALEEEMDFVKRYIDYYSFRNERLKVHQRFEGDFDGIMIPPLFFLPLVENAVKFSGETTAPTISLHLHTTRNSLVFTLNNNFLAEGSRQHGTGIGIENLKRRLEVYGLKHELLCYNKAETFTTKLTIWGLSTAAL